MEGEVLQVRIKVDRVCYQYNEFAGDGSTYINVCDVFRIAIGTTVQTTIEVEQ